MFSKSSRGRQSIEPRWDGPSNLSAEVLFALKTCRDFQGRGRNQPDWTIQYPQEMGSYDDRVGARYMNRTYPEGSHGCHWIPR